MNTQAVRKDETKLMDLNQFLKPNIVAIGPKSFYNNLMRRKDFFNLEIIFDDSLSALEKVNKDTVAILLDERVLGNNIGFELEKICREYFSQAVYILTTKVKNPQFYRFLYAKGLHGVFEWKNDAEIFLDLLVESLKPHPKAHGKSKSDDKLAEFVKTRILTEAKGYQNIEVKCFDGHIFLDGHVDTLASKDELEKICSHASGVQYVNTRNVFVFDPAPVNDHLMRLKIKEVLTKLSKEYGANLLMKFRKGNLDLYGRVNSTMDLEAILDEIKEIQGIFHIYNHIKLRNLQAKKLKEMSYKKAEKLVKKIFSGVKAIKIWVNGPGNDEIIVSGEIYNEVDKGLLEHYLKQKLQVKKIVNKLRYVSAP